MTNVLVVDDDESIREVAQMSLELVGGWTVTTASSGPEAITAASAKRPDAVLLDVMMPGMDGPTTCRLLHENPGTRDIPIIFLTAKVQRTEQKEWDELPIAGVLAKPFDPMRLCRSVSSLLGWTDDEGEAAGP